MICGLEEKTVPLQFVITLIAAFVPALYIEMKLNLIAEAISHYKGFVDISD